VNEVIERVALAMLAAVEQQHEPPYLAHRDGQWADEVFDLSDVMIDGNVDFRAMARAAIEALK
jgi:hypothetical protein